MTEKKIKNNKQEQGRSMVEMLGVLAVVGVLSVGGIAGYTYAMNKHYANEIVHTVSMMALTASQGLLINGDFSLSEYGDEVAGYAFEYDTNHSNQDNDFSITVKDIGEGVCERVMDFEWTLPYSIMVNGIESGECKDMNDITFVFMDDLDGYWEEMTLGTCTGKFCISCPIDKTVKCAISGDGVKDCICISEDDTEGIDWACSKYECITCPPDKKPDCSGNRCQCISEGEIGTCGAESCITCETNETPMCPKKGECICVPKDKTGYCGNNGCITCSLNEVPKCTIPGVLIDSHQPCVCVAKDAIEDEDWACNYQNCITCSENERAVCAGGVQSADGIGKNSCVCVPENGIEDENWKCNDYACWACAENETLKCSSAGTGDMACVCVPEGAVEGKNWTCSKNNCIYCPNGETPKCATYDSQGTLEKECVCVAKGGTSACSNSSCISCPTGETAKCPSIGEGCICASSEETVKCSSNGACIIVPEGETAICGSYECISCPAGETPKCASSGRGEKACICVPEGEKAYCSSTACISCSGRKTPLCSGSWVDYDAGACICVPEGETARCNDYACISCPEKKAPICQGEGCACLDIMDNEAICDDMTNPQFKGTDGLCYSCNETASVYTNSDQCSKCENSSTPRFLGADGLCYLCDTSSDVYTTLGHCYACDDTNNPRFMGEDGRCYSCAESSFISTTSAQCSRCEGTNKPRVMIDGKCYPDCRTSETPLISSTGSCSACDTATSITTDEAACSRCSELRTMENGKCVLKNCPVIDGEVYVKNRTGACTKCSAAGIPYSDIGHLEVCKAAGYPRFTNAAGTISYLCSRAKLGSSNADVCHLCNYAGSPVPRFMGTDNYCYPCSESTSVATSAKECAVCGGSRSYDATTGKCSKAS